MTTVAGESAARGVESEMLNMGLVGGETGVVGKS